ncbi:MAG: FtsH protease activity modulator HflK [Granulosicoccus sp.]|nr:FtsH protease activity modulator HflK [Granulosicoccus sp.]
MAWNEPGGNDNDPWGNRKNNNGAGPPDLDEVVKNLKNWVNSAFGKKSDNGGSNSGNNGSSGGSSGSGNSQLPLGNLGGKAVGLVAAVAFAIWLMSGIYVIQPAEAGVVTQFGAYVKTTTPGPHWKIPWPVQSVEKVDVEEVRTATLSDALILTQDENIVDIDLAVQYNIKSAEDYLFNVYNPDRTLEEVVESAVREVVGATRLEGVLIEAAVSEESAEEEVVDIWENTTVSLQDVLDSYGSGILVTAVNLLRAQPPEEVQAAFSDAIKAREDKERIINVAQAYANRVLPQARGDAQRALEESEAYRARVEQAALGESDRFLSLLAEYRKAPAVTRERLYLEAMETVLGNTSKVLVDNESGNSLMYLPIDQLINQGPRSTDNSALNGESPLNSINNDAPRFSDLPTDGIPSRDNLRSRDRGSIR